MQKLLGLILALFAAVSVAHAQNTTVTSGGAIYDSTSGAFVGHVNLVTGKEERIGRRATQSSPPSCTTNCGTSPSVTGSDTAMRVTMGATGVPASGWIVAFNLGFPAAPACIVQSALSSMVVGKMAIAVQTTTNTITVTTNGTAPGNSDVYSIICGGVN